MKNIARFRLLYIFCHALIPVAIFAGSSGWWIYALIWYFILQVLGVGIGMHRLLAHHSFTARPLSFRFLTLLSVLTGMGSPITWAAIHRDHHRHADLPNDPHDPRKMGFWGILLGSYNRDIRVSVKGIPDLLESRWLRFLHRNYFAVLFVYAAVLTLIDPRLLLFQFAVPIAMVYWATALGIFLNHSYGYRNFETSDYSVNSWILSLYTLGDGWHNNHHANPSRYSHRVKWWEFDLCAVLIKYAFAESRGGAR